MQDSPGTSVPPTASSTSPAVRTRESSGPRYQLGSILVLGVVILWVSEVKLLQKVQTDEWKKPYCVGITLKATWIIGMIPLLVVHHVMQRRRADNPELPPPAEHSLRLSWPLLRVCGGLSFLVIFASVSWVASLERTSTSANSAIYQVAPITAPIPFHPSPLIPTLRGAGIVRLRLHILSAAPQRIDHLRQDPRRRHRHPWR